MIKNDKGRFEFEDKDARIEQAFVAAMDQERGCQMAMAALVGSMTQTTKRIKVAWGEVRELMTKDGLLPDGMPKCATIYYDNDTGEVHFKE
jgi:hypothetical protein